MGGAVVGVAAVVVVVAAAVAAVSVFVALVDMPVLVLLGVTTPDVETDVVVILVVPRVRREDRDGEEEKLVELEFVDGSIEDPVDVDEEEEEDGISKCVVVGLADNHALDE